MSSQVGKKILSVTLATSTTLWISGISLVAPFLVSAGHGNLVDGDLLRVGSNPKVYVAKLVGAKHFKRWMMTYEIFSAYGHLKMSNVKSVAQADADAYAEAVLIREAGDTKVYHVDTAQNQKHWVRDVTAFTANNWDWDSIYTVNTKELSLYPEGAAITGAIAASPSPTTTVSPSPSPSPTTTTLPGSVLRLEAPATQVAAMTLVADNNVGGGGQSLADVMKIKFAAGTDGDVKVKKLVLTRSGISADADIFDMYLYDGTTRVAETPSIGSAKVTFTNSAGMFTVAKGTVKEITVKLDLTSNTAGGKTMKLSVASSADVESDGAAVQGTFPLDANTHSTANVTDLGRIVFQNSSPTAATTVDPQNDLEIWRFTAQASNQDIELRRVRITIVGTIVTTDLVNVKILDGGVQIGSTVANLDSNKVADFTFASPLKIKSGVTKTLTLRADVVGGTNRTFRPSVQKRSDIEVYDAGYKVSLRPMTATGDTDTFSIMQPNANADFSGANRDFTINAGTLTVTVATDSPSGNVANASTNVTLARYDFKAAGENIKVTDLAVCLDRDALVAATDGLANGQLFINTGVGKADYIQIGTTDTLLRADDTAGANCDNADDFNAFSLGSQFIINSGTTRQLEVRADISNSGGTATAAGNTYVIALNAGNSSNAANAQGLVSLTTITAPAADLVARTVTNATGAISVAVNGALADYTNANALIVGQSKAKIASIVITAGAGEAVDVTSLVLQANGTDGREWGRNMTNLMVCKVGTACAAAGDQIGQTATSLSTTDEAETKTFTISPAIRVNAGGQLVVDVHADILSSATDTALSIVGVRVGAAGASATGINTGTSSTAPTAATAMQSVYIAASGSFTIRAAPSSALPVAQIYKMSTAATGTGVNEVVVGKFELVAQFENYNVERITVNDTFNAGATSTRASSTLKNIRLYVGSVGASNLLAGPGQLVSTITPVVGGYADFNGGFSAVSSQGITVAPNGANFVVPKDSVKTIVVTAETNQPLQAASGQTHLFSLQANTQLSAPGPQRAVVVKGSVSSVSSNGPTANTNIGNTYEVRRNYPIVMPDVSGIPVLATGANNDKTIYKFKIQVPAGDEMRLKKMTFEVTLNDTTTTSGVLAVANWRLRRDGAFLTNTDYHFFNGAVATTSAISSLGGEGSIAGCASDADACDNSETDGLRTYVAGFTANTNVGNSTTTNVILGFVTEETVKGGETKTYELVANVTNVGAAGSTDNDSISIRILGDTNALGGEDRGGEVAVRQGFNVAALLAAQGVIFTVDGDLDDSNFIWSDVWPGTIDHGTVTGVTGTVSTGNDWTNGAVIPENTTATDFLPSTSFTLTR